jgi:DoxX-like protein
MARDLDWAILRPSVVVGRAAYGGSALFRGLAALPVLARVPDTGPLQVVQLDDLVRTVLFFLEPGAPAHVVLEVAGSERLTLDDVLAAYRRWLGRKPAPTVTLPRWVSRIAFWIGDGVGLLGWRPPLRSTVRLEIARGAVGDPAPWMRLTGIEPRTLGAALAAEPASVQERWFARLYFLKPLTLAVLSLYWIGTGLVALGPGWQDSVALIGGAGARGMAGPLLAAAGAIADILIGIGIAVRRAARISLYAALALSIAYVTVGTLQMPGLWGDPLGPLLKVLPIMVLTLMALAILDDR